MNAFKKITSLLDLQYYFKFTCLFIVIAQGRTRIINAQL